MERVRLYPWTRRNRPGRVRPGAQRGAREAAGPRLQPRVAPVARAGPRLAARPVAAAHRTGRLARARDVAQQPRPPGVAVANAVPGTPLAGWLGPGLSLGSAQTDRPGGRTTCDGRA